MAKTFKCSMSKKKESLSKVTENIKSAEFTIVGGFVDVNEDDYEDGEGKHYKTYSLKDISMQGNSYKSISELLSDIAEHGIYEDRYANPDNWLASEYQNGVLRIETDVTTDENDFPASDDEIERWKQGEKILYSAHWAIKIRCIYTDVIPMDILSDELKGMDVDF